MVYASQFAHAKIINAMPTKTKRSKANRSEMKQKLIGVKVNEQNAVRKIFSDSNAKHLITFR